MRDVTIEESGSLILRARRLLGRYPQLDAVSLENLECGAASLSVQLRRATLLPFLKGDWRRRQYLPSFASMALASTEYSELSWQLSRRSPIGQQRISFPKDRYSHCLSGLRRCSLLISPAVGSHREAVGPSGGGSSGRCSKRPRRQPPPAPRTGRRPGACTSGIGRPPRAP